MQHSLYILKLTLYWFLNMCDIIHDREIRLTVLISFCFAQFRSRLQNFTLNRNSKINKIINETEDKIEKEPISQMLRDSLSFSG